MSPLIETVYRYNVLKEKPLCSRREKRKSEWRCGHENNG
jgi:hypothetical protein